MVEIISSFSFVYSYARSLDITLIVRIALSLVLMRQSDSSINLYDEVKSLCKDYLKAVVEDGDSVRWEKAIFENEDDDDMKEFRKLAGYKSQRYCL